MEYAVVAGRIVTIMGVLLAIALIMGQRHVGELPVFDFLVVITIGAVAGADIADPSIKHGPTAMAIVLLGLLQVAVSWGMMKFHWLGRAVSFEPMIIVEEGILRRDRLARLRYTLDDILPLFRQQGVFDLAEVHYAIIEPDGSLSIMKKAPYRSVTPAELQVWTEQGEIPAVLVVDGAVDYEALTRLGKDQPWLEQGLKKAGFPTIMEVFLAQGNTTGLTYVVGKKPPEERLPPVRH